MNKRIISLLFTIILIITSVSLDVSATDVIHHTSGNFKYTILEDGTAEISDYTGVDSVVDSSGEITKLKVSCKDGDLLLEGDLCVSIVIKDTASSFTEIKKIFEFGYKKHIGVFQDSIYCEPQVSVLSVKCSAKNQNTIDVRGEILVSGSVSGQISINAVSNITEVMKGAPLPEDTYEEIRTLAKKAYKAMDCSGFSRVDFFVDKDNGNVYINEINTIPGFTKYSMFPMMWKEVGVPFGELIERIVDYGYERYHIKNHR